MKKLLTLILILALVYLAMTKLGLIGEQPAERTVEERPARQQRTEEASSSTSGTNEKPKGVVDSMLEYGTGYTAFKAKQRSKEKLDNLQDDRNKRLSEELSK